MRATDPNFPILFDRTSDELEENLLFCIVVAGKKASIQIRLLHDFLKSLRDGKTQSPFELIRRIDSAGGLVEKLRAARIGQYTRLVSCFRELVSSGLDLSTCTVEDLEAVHGIGPKTARFFMTCNRQDVKHAVIDTHLLKFMSQHLGVQAPSTTPSSKKEYERLENTYLTYADKIGVNAAELDLAIWKMYANRDDTDFLRLTNSSNPQTVAV